MSLIKTYKAKRALVSLRGRQAAARDALHSAQTRMKELEQCWPLYYDPEDRLAEIAIEWQDCFDEARYQERRIKYHEEDEYRLKVIMHDYRTREARLTSLKEVLISQLSLIQLPRVNITAHVPEYGRMLRLLSHLLPRSLRRSTWEPYSHELVEDRHDALKRYRKKGARRWLNFCYGLKAVLYYFDTIRVGIFAWLLKTFTKPIVDLFNSFRGSN